MNLLILGATGGTGQQLVAQATQAGHEVAAFVRHPDKLALRHPRLAVVTGDACDPNDLTRALEGKDAVLSALGAGKSLTSDIASTSMAALIPALKSSGVKRAIVCTAFGVGSTLQQAAFLQRIAFRLVLRRVYSDKEQANAALRHTALDWTLVFPVLLSNGPRTGQYRVGEALDMSGMPRISRADVADFMLRQLSDATWIRRNVVISN
jgi:putative NADH-flavin reductase